MILLIDNYDSFAHNLARYFELMGQSVRVVRNNAVDIESISTFDALVVSPGPCAPDQAGQTLAALRAAIGSVPVLGVCLGHQAIVQVLGGTILPSGAPVHGRTSEVTHDGQLEFEGLANPLTVARYHSLIAHPPSMPKSLTVSATTEDGTIMAVRHCDFPVVGWQFHPESILTPAGFALLAGFLRLAEIEFDAAPSFANELPGNRTRNDETDGKWPSGVTF